MTDDDITALPQPCPYCGEHTLYRPPGWVEGGPVACANPWCDSDMPPEDEDAEREPPGR